MASARTASGAASRSGSPGSLCFEHRPRSPGKTTRARQMLETSGLLTQSLGSPPWALDATSVSACSSATGTSTSTASSSRSTTASGLHEQWLIRAAADSHRLTHALSGCPACTAERAVFKSMGLSRATRVCRLCSPKTYSARPRSASAAPLLSLSPAWALSPARPSWHALPKRRSRSGGSTPTTPASAWPAKATTGSPRWALTHASCSTESATRTPST